MTRLTSLMRPWVVVTLAALLFSLAIIVTQGGPLALVTIGTRFSQGDPEGSEGYDGQFVYVIALDPATAPAYIARGGDVPAYRFQRILLPFLGRVLSFGQAALIPWMLLGVNLVALCGGTALLEQLLVDQKVSRWYALGYGLSLAGVGCVRLSLTEPLAYGLAIGGIYLAQKNRWLTSALLFALAALAKETALILAAGYGLYLLKLFLVPPTPNRADENATKQASPPGSSRLYIGGILILFSAIALTPFIVWQLILRERLGAFGIGSGGNLATNFEIVPFLGYFRILTEGTPAIFMVLSLFLLPFVILPTLWGLSRAVTDIRANNLSVYSYLLFIACAIMLFVPFSTYREPLGILRFIAGLQIALILYAAEHKLRRPLRYSVLWALTTLLTTFGVA